MVIMWNWYHDHFFYKSMPVSDVVSFMKTFYHWVVIKTWLMWIMLVLRRNSHISSIGYHVSQMHGILTHLRLGHREFCVSWIGHLGSLSTLLQIMACCLTAPSHYLNQCWLYQLFDKFQPRHNNFLSRKYIWKFFCKAFRSGLNM